MDGIESRRIKKIEGRVEREAERARLRWLAVFFLRLALAAVLGGGFSC